MKKLCLSLGAVLLSAAVLASCGNSLKKPKDKGKAVNEIEVELAHDTLSISKDDTFADVHYLISDCNVYMNYEDGENNDESFNYIVQSKMKEKAKCTNYIALNYGAIVDGAVVAEKYEISGSYSSTIDAYYKKKTDSNLNVKKESYSNSVLDYNFKYNTDGDKFSTKAKTVSAYGGSYNVDRDGTQTLDFAKYDYRNIDNKTTTKSSTEGHKEKDSTYEYVKETDKPDSNTYNKMRCGYDTDGRYYTYNIDSYFDYGYCDSFTIDNYVPYDEAFDDVSNFKFELTDKYIILKGSGKITSAMISSLNDAIGGSYTDEYYETVLDYLNKDYKGSKIEAEIWIGYTNTYADNPDAHYLTLNYAYIKETTKMDFKRTYDEKYFDNNYFYDKFKDELMGKEYTLKGSFSRSYYVYAEEENYSKKISSLKSSAKKNNVYDRIDLKIYD